MALVHHLTALLFLHYYAPAQLPFLVPITNHKYLSRSVNMKTLLKSGYVQNHFNHILGSEISEVGQHYRVPQYYLYCASTELYYYMHALE